jgi:hypothetical protein
MGQYIRGDKRKGKTYYYLVESYRDGDKVVQKRLKYLGTRKPTLAAAIRQYLMDKASGQPRRQRPKPKTIIERKPTKPVATEEDDLSWLLGP